MKMLLTGIMLTGLLGCGDLSSTSNTEESKSEQTDKKGKGSIFGKTTREILNANDAIKNQNYVIVVLDVQGSDPFSQAPSAYGKLASFAGTIPIQQWIKRKKIVEEHTPTHEELQEWMKKNPGITLPVLPFKRVYGYDETKGEMVILEKKDQQ